MWMLKKCLISLRVLDLIIEDIHRYRHNETGGLLFGERRKNTFVITEIFNESEGAERTPTSFTFNIDERAKRDCADLIINKNLSIAGVWHKHNNLLMPPFSKEDDDINMCFAKLNKRGSLSVIVQEYGKDFCITAYLVTSSPHLKYKKIPLQIF